MKKLFFLLAVGLAATFFACQKQNEAPTPEATNPKLQLVSPLGFRLAESVESLKARIQETAGKSVGTITEITNISYKEINGKCAAKIEMLNDKGVAKEVVMTTFVPKGIDAPEPTERKIDFILIAWCNLEECSSCSMLIFYEEYLDGWGMDIVCTCCSLSFILFY